MRILLITIELVSDYSPSGGQGNSVRRFATALNQFGHQALILGPGCPIRGEPNVSPGVAVFRARNPTAVRWLDVLFLRRFNMALTTLARARAVSRAISQLTPIFRPDAIVYPNLGAVGLLRPLRTPSIIRISSDTRLSRDKGGYDNQSPFAMFQQIVLEDKALKRADAAFAPSSLTAARVTQKLKLPVDLLRTPFFLETPNEDDSIYRHRFSGTSYMIFVGLLNRLKGVPDIAETLAPLLSHHRDLHFVFVGKEHAGFAGRTMKNHTLALAGKHSDRVHFLGEVQHDRLFPLIRGAKAVVLPSLVDNLPNTCLEAMALAKVVVGTRGTSFEELLEDGVSGILCQPGNPQSLEHAMGRVLSLSQEEIESIGRNASNFARQFEPARTIPPLVAYFERVIKNHRNTITQGRK